MLRCLFLLPLIVLASCSREDDAGPVRVDMIGEAPELAGALRGPPSAEQAFMLDATAQGLVRFDAEGQIEPALAKRWTVLDNGRSYIFRLDDLQWEDGTALTAGQVARQLRRAIRAGSGNRLAPLLADIEEVNAVTPEILEIILKRPRADFLPLLAQSDLAIFIESAGLGPFAIAEQEEGQKGHLLVPSRPLQSTADDGAAPPDILPEETVRLRFSRPALAVTRFRLGRSDLVTGGDWTTLAYAEAIDPSATQLVFDPVDGLFGLAFVEESGFLATADNRTILSMAIDRQRLAELFGSEHAEPRSIIVPPASEGLGPFELPGWIEAELPARRGFARDAVNRWQAANGPVAPLRVALPDHAGSRLIFAVLRSGWRAIGIEAQRVDWDADADLRLVDRVAATGRASWYFNQFRCNAEITCSADYAQALASVDEAGSLRTRAFGAGKAARALQDMAPFIPLLRPVRWSLVSPRLTGFHANSHAAHPLDRLVERSGEGG